MHLFTSITNNYLPKARILAKSVKEKCKDYKFTLVLCDSIPENFNLQDEPFDEVLTIDLLGIPVENLNLWIFMHSVVELCTAVKGQSLYKFLNEGSDKVVYLDPDTAVFENLIELESLLEERDVILTPHLTHPERNDIATILDNEVCSLMHGAYNFGFFAVKNNKNGLAFARWWRDRLVNFCYDDIPNGLFTDQKWGDLVPCMFDGVHILRDPGYNVATWNINNRKITLDNNNKYWVNGSTLKFYHFSGFDSGAQEGMLLKYGAENKALWSLREWYIRRQDEEGQDEFGQMPSIYSKYSNGKTITSEERKLLKNRQDLQKEFSDSDPFAADLEMAKSYYHWYQDNFVIKASESNVITIEKDYLEKLNFNYRQEIDSLHTQLDEVYHSTSWKLTKGVRLFKDFLLGFKRFLKRVINRLRRKA